MSLYVHLPWCVSKCPYCDFNSYEVRAGVLPEREYIDALLRDLRFNAELLRERELVSIFFGGGTPSLISVSALSSVLEAVAAIANLDSQVEITLEANPGAADAGRFAGYRRLGVNRLSIGAQSFNDDKLARLGRQHDAQAGQDAVTAARQAGFDNINIDLMYGLPEQTPAQALSDLAMAVELEPAHISWYQLTIEPNTAFYKTPPPLPDDDLTTAMQTQGGRCLREHGYRQYEVSAWGRDGCECRHNLNYWQFGDYIGIGAGAHGKFSHLKSPETAQSSPLKISRQARLRVPASYIRHAGTDSAIAEHKTLSREDCILEFMLNALRLEAGTTEPCFTERTGLSPTTIRSQVNAATRDGLLHDVAGQIRATPKGARYLNELLHYFM